MFRFIEALRWLIRLAIWGFLLTLLAVAAWTFLWPDSDLNHLGRADAIICLGAGMEPDGTLDPATETRVARCVELYEAGIAPIIVFSGGPATPGGISAGQQMANAAFGMLLPPSAALIEGHAQSTLQNAVFSLPMVPRETKIVLVSEAFHLPRSWVSFKWAGAQNVSLVSSEKIRTNPDSGRPEWSMILREAAAIWFNAGRGAGYSIAGFLGVPETERLTWLR